jgi:hypothetical protein
MSKHTVALIYRILLAVVALTGIIFNLIGRDILETFIFFTIQSNTLALIIITVNLVFMIKKKAMHEKAPILLTIKAIITMNLLITFIGFHFLLRPTMIGDDPDGYLTSVENILLHYVVPIMMIIDYLIFDPKGYLTIKKVPLFLIYPYAYLIFAIVRATFGGVIEAVGSRYPYFFLDVDYLGFGIIYYVLGMTVFFGLLGVIFTLIDKRL